MAKLDRLLPYVFVLTATLCVVFNFYDRATVWLLFALFFQREAKHG